MEITIASLSGSSMKQYDNPLRRWWRFCVDNNIPLTKANPTDVIRFLTIRYNEGAAYGSLNTMRSAIALIIGPEIGQNAEIKRFFKGIARLRPSEPKYQSTWDPKIVLYYLKKRPSESLSLEDLTKKLVTLIALITGQRMQTLALIDVRNIRESVQSIEIKVPDTIKTSGPNKSQPALTLPFYNEDKNICAAKTLQCYLARTKDLRRENNKRLFISFKKPHGVVSAQTLSRWIKAVLAQSGVDTNTFTAYSTRHAATSAAKRRGVSIDTIKRTAGWTEKSSTFAKFYDKPVSENVCRFARAILTSDD